VQNARHRRRGHRGGRLGDHGNAEAGDGGEGNGLWRRGSRVVQCRAMGRHQRYLWCDPVGTSGLRAGRSACSGRWGGSRNPGRLTRLNRCGIRLQLPRHATIYLIPRSAYPAT
jgi:hypothetical protein